MLFHPPDISIDDLPANRDLDQWYIFHFLEAPGRPEPQLYESFNKVNGRWTTNYEFPVPLKSPNSRAKFQLPPDFYNVTLSYYNDSDYFLPYDSFERIDKETNVEEIWTEEEVG